MNNKSLKNCGFDRLSKQQSIEKELTMSEKDLIKVFDQNQDLRMSSREVADLTGKRHDNVYRDISELNDSYAKMGLLKVEDTPYIHPQNKQRYYEFQLTKMQCDLD